MHLHDFKIKNQKINLDKTKLKGSKIVTITEKVFPSIEEEKKPEDKPKIQYIMDDWDNWHPWETI